MRAYMTADNVTRFARVDFRNDQGVFGIKDEDRFLHLYIIGKTGTGKSCAFRRSRPLIPIHCDHLLRSIATSVDGDESAIRFIC
jgi:hypothetical protein